MKQSQKRKDIIKISKLYYHGNMSQNQIAQLMNISRPKVSRMLTEAHQLNIVQIIVRDPQVTKKELAEILRKHFKLHFVEVVETANTDAATKINVGRIASNFLNDNLQNDSKIGISWGTTLAAFTNEFQAKRLAPQVKIAQLIGGTYSQSLNIDGRELVKTLAKKLQCEHSILQAPMLVHNPKLKEMIMEEPVVQEHFSLISQLDMAFVGIGASYYKDSIAYRANYIQESVGLEMNRMGLVCDICGHQLMPDGSEPHTFFSDRIIGIELEQLHKIPLVVGLCVGYKKTIPLLAALRGRHINSLILDEIVALVLMTEENLMP